jgi:tungstate transport system substrate-binding protein
VTRRAAVLAAAAVLASRAPAAGNGHLRLATTTSVENSGLCAAILPVFEGKTGLKVDVIAVGTGQAIKLGESGDVDAVLVHDPALEEAFVKSGGGIRRTLVMVNDFVVLGPAADPAGVRSATAPADAFRRIAAAGGPFVSRGDGSGTHIKEKALWREAGAAPSGTWYLEAGQGMGPVILMADEKRAYTFADRGTWLAMREKADLAIVYENPEALRNEYHVVAVNPARWPHVRAREARALIRWLVSREAQDLIGGFRKGGVRLFRPAAGPG